MVLLALEEAPQVLDPAREVLVGAELPALQAVGARPFPLAQDNHPPMVKLACNWVFRANGATTSEGTSASRKPFARPRPHTGA